MHLREDVRAMDVGPGMDMEWIWDECGVDESRRGVDAERMCNEYGTDVGCTRFRLIVGWEVHFSRV